MTVIACQRTDCEFNSKDKSLPKCQKARIVLSSMDLGEKKLFKCTSYREKTDTVKGE